MHNNHTRYDLYWSNSCGFVFENYFQFILSLEISLLAAGVTLDFGGRDIWPHNHHHRDIGCWGGIYELVYSLPSPHTILHPRFNLYQIISFHKIFEKKCSKLQYSHRFREEGEQKSSKMIFAKFHLSVKRGFGRCQHFQLLRSAASVFDEVGQRQFENLKK